MLRDSVLGQRRRCAWVLLAVLLAGRWLSAGAQRPADSSLIEEMHRAVGLAQHGDEKQALVLTSAIVDEHPEYGPGLKLQGMLLEDLGRSQEAAVPYEKALKLSPNDPELLMKVGIFHLVTGDKEQAVEMFVRLLKIKPADEDALYYLAQAYYLQGKNELALKTIRRDVTLAPRNGSVLQKYGELLCSSGNNEEALRWLLKAQQIDPTLERMDLDLGVASYKGMHIEDAAKYSAKAVELQPENLDAVALLAAAQLKLSDWKNAQANFAKILAVKADDTSALLGLGRSEMELKEYQASMDALHHLLELDPTQILAHFYLSRDYMGLGKTVEAQHEADLHSEMLERASSAASPGDTAHERVIWERARGLLREKHEAAALQLFREDSRGPAATPGGPYVLVGALYVYMGRPEDGLRMLKRAQTIEPGVRGAHTYLGVLAMQEGDLSAAESEFEAELAREPNDQMAVSELGEVRYRQGLWADAATELARSKTVKPSMLYLLCDSYFHMGKVKEADLTAELLRAYAKDDPQVMQSLVDLLNRNQQTELAQKLSSATAP